MAKILYLNNFECQFIDAVKDVPTTGTPATELNYGILRLNNSASGVLLNPAGGDYYLLTAFKRSGGAESMFEVMKVTSVDIATYPGECRITVSRAQEGTTAKAYVTGDLVQLRWTKGSAEAVVQRDATETLTNKTLTTPVLTNPSYSGTTANGGTVTTIDINGGTADGVVIGGTAPAAGSFTELAVKSGLLGYGTGAGGTVTQATSKSTAVTLNKPCGQITMNNAALAAGARVGFVLSNSLIGGADTVNANVAYNAGYVGANYRAYATQVGPGGTYMFLENTSGSYLSDAVVINFSVNKVATS